MTTDPYHNKKHVPSKRLKNWHRPSADKISLKAFAEGLIAGENQADQAYRDRAKTANAWFANKAAQ